MPSNMMDVGLYAITPYQFRIAHDIGLENFLSPSEEQPIIDLPGNEYSNQNNKSSSATTTAQVDLHLTPSEQTRGDSTYTEDTHHKRHHQHNSNSNSNGTGVGGKNGYRTKAVPGGIGIDAGIFTLTLENRPEKRERTRSGSDANSPDAKRLGGNHDGGATCIKELREEDDNGNISPETSASMESSASSSSSSSSVFQPSGLGIRGRSDSEETIGRHSAGPGDNVSPVPGCSYHHHDDPVRHRPRTPSPDTHRSENEKPPVVVRRKRRPRKLPQIPANAQPKSVATLLQGQSIADELSDVKPCDSSLTLRGSAGGSVSRSQRAMKAMSWIESSSRTSPSHSSQDSGSFSHGGYQSLDELGSPEDVGSSHMEMVEKFIIQKDLMENRQSLTRSMTLDSTASSQCVAGNNDLMSSSYHSATTVANVNAVSNGDGDDDDDVTTPLAEDARTSMLMSASMSMSLMEELESEGVEINHDLGSTFYDHSEYIDDEMPKLKKYFGEDPGDMPRRTTTVSHNNNGNNSQGNNNNGGYHHGNHDSNRHSALYANRRGRHRADSQDDAYTSPDDRFSRQSSRSKNSRSRTVSATSSGGRSRHPSSSSSYSGDLEALDATHRGCHKFIPRHPDELFIEIGDMISVQAECEDLWCEGVNLNTGKKGIFPAAYATDLNLLEDNEGTWKFKLRFLGSVEVSQHRGNDAICTAIQRVVQSRREALDAETPPLYCVQINEYGIKMMDTSKKQKQPQIRSSIREKLAKILNKEIKEERDTDHFFTLKNVTFCGFHPRNERYFAFITKHPNEMRFACHVFLSERSTVRICEAVGAAFRRFYQEYMAFTHPTEDIYIE